MFENISFLLLLLIAHQLHYLYQSPLPHHQLAYAFGMVQLPKPNRRRSGFARTTSPFDAKRRANRASRHSSHAGSGSSGTIRGPRENGSQHGGDSSTGDLSDQWIDLPDTTLPAEHGAEAEIMEVSLGDEVDMLEIESNKELPSDRTEGLQCDSTKGISEPNDNPKEESSPKDPAKVSLREEVIEPFQEPKNSNDPEQLPLDTQEVDHIIQCSSEEPRGRNLPPEDPDKYVPLNLKISAYARQKLKRRSLEGIEPISDRKAKLPLGPRDAPDKK